MLVKDRISRAGSVERHEARVGRAELWFYVDHHKHLVDLSVLKVPARHRRRGEGSEALRQVLALADRLGYSVRLGASPLDNRTSLPRLIRFYERYGFKLTGFHINLNRDPEMVRPALRGKR